ncbi:helicase ATP-binding domain-containing protein, partial [Haematococcus lacustris]
ATGVWQGLSAVKEVVVEPREAGKAFEQAMLHYKKVVDEGRGALLLAVCRGKASEGIDFADAHARGVVIVGIPYPALKDTRVS